MIPAGHPRTSSGAFCHGIRCFVHQGRGRGAWGAGARKRVAIMRGALVASACFALTLVWASVIITFDFGLTPREVRDAIASALLFMGFVSVREESATRPCPQRRSMRLLCFSFCFVLFCFLVQAGRRLLFVLYSSYKNRYRSEREIN